MKRKRGWKRNNRLLVGKEDQDGRAKKYLEADKESLKEGKEIIQESRKRMD